MSHRNDERADDDKRARHSERDRDQNSAGSARRSGHYQTLLAILAILGFWTILHVALHSAIIPSPWQTGAAFLRILPILARHLLASLGRIAAAIAAAGIAGSAIGLWTGLSRRADALVSPIVYLLYPVPKIAFLPILMLLFGLGNLPKVLLIVFIIIFQFVIATRDGVREIPRELYYSVRSLGLGQAGLYRHLILPAVLPRIITSLRITFGVSVSVLFFGESFATENGIGYFIMNAWLLADYVEMFAGILALSLLGLVIFQLIDLLERRFCRWALVSRPAA